jgi:VWFA-related protein
MTKKRVRIGLVAAGLVLARGVTTDAQQDETALRVNVNLVQLNVAVTDNKGNYVTGLRPQDFIVSEDKLVEKIATFEEGSAPLHPGPSAPAAADASNDTIQATHDTVAAHTEPAADAPKIPVSPFSGANVFILFDTSNYMYRGFVYAQDAISGFVHSMQGASKVALYSYSRNLYRAAPLTANHMQVLQGLRSTVAGDQAALYDSLLLTVKDAARVNGRKVIVVFSNGPDDASTIPPEDVAELAQSTGTVIYIVSTREAEQEPMSTAIFERMSKATGGKAYFAKSWRDEAKAFASIQDDLAHLYFISYYPQPNENRGWRAISVKLAGKDLQKFHVRTRDGYRLQQAKAVDDDLAESGIGPSSASSPK